MAYPTVDAPYGLKPINLLGGTPFAGAVRHMAIASGYATDLFNGDLVKHAGDGTIIKDPGTDGSTGPLTAAPCGVFLGCSYTNPSTKQKLFSQMWPAGTVAADAMAYVCDDPSTLFKIVNVSGTTVVAGAARNVIGGTANLVQNAGNPATGNSKLAATGAGAGTASAPLKVVDVVEDTKLANGTYVELIVRLNTSGVTAAAPQLASKGGEEAKAETTKAADPKAAGKKE